MEEYRVSICVRASNRETVNDWLSYLHFITDEIPEFFWTIDEVEKGSAFND